MQCCTWMGLLVANSVERQIRQAAYVLSHGGVVAVPTDTVYGLAADARSSAAVGKVLELKGRSQDAPMPLLVADIAQAETIAGPLSGTVRAFAARFCRSSADSGPGTIFCPRAMMPSGSPPSASGNRLPKPCACSCAKTGGLAGNRDRSSSAGCWKSWTMRG